MAKIRWTREASLWLSEIYDYIATDSQSAAAGVVEAIYRKAQYLSDFPAAGHIYRTEPEGESRILLYGHYRIAYLFRDQVDLIDILGIFHASLDISRYL